MNKNILKKYISLFIALVLMSAIFNFNIIGDKANAESEDVSKEEYILSYLGIIEKSEDDEDIQKSITRADFADMLVKALKLGEVNDMQYFDDVDFSHWASGAINALAKAEIVNGNGGGVFEPDEKITYAQALKMLSKPMGYSVYAEANGGFPTGYIKTAVMTKINITLQNSDSLSMGEAIRLLYNAFSTKTYNVSSVKGSDGRNTNQYDVSDDTLFKIYYNLYIDEGTFNSYYGGAMEGASEVESGECTINNEKYSVIFNADIKDFFAENVEFAYIKKSDTQKDVIYIEKQDSGKTTVINSEDLDAFDESAYQIRYYNNNTLRSVSPRRDAEIIYNGNSETSLTLKDIIGGFIDKKYRGYVKLRDIDNDGGYETIVVYGYISLSVSGQSSDGKIIYDEYSSSKSIDTDAYEKVTFKDSNGWEYTDKLKTPSVISYAASTDKKYLEIIVSDKTSDIKISTVIESEYKIRIDGGNEINVEKACFDRKKNDIKQSSNIAVIYDIFGYICYIGKTEDTIKSGYLAALAAEDSGFDKKVMLKIYTEDGKLEVFNTSSKVKIDGVSYDEDDAAAIYTALGIENIKSDADLNGSIKMKRQLILYKVNSDNKITYIDTAKCNGPYENKDDTLSKLKQYSESGRYYYGGVHFGLKIVWDEKATKIFSVPNENAMGRPIDAKGNEVADEEKLYNLGAAFKAWTAYTIDVYHFDDSQIYASAIVVKEAAAAPDKYPCLAIEKAEGINEDGENVTLVRALYEGAVTEFTVSDDVDISNLDEGDIFIVTKNTKNYITDVTILYDRSENKFINKTPKDDVLNYDSTADIDDGYGGGLLNVDYGLTKGRIQKIRGYYTMSIFENAPESEEFSRVDYLEGSKIYVVDSQKRENRVYRGSMADIVSAENDGTGSFAVFSTKTTRTNFVAIYK